MDLTNRWMWVGDDFCGGVNFAEYYFVPKYRGQLSYLAPLGSENISAPYFK